MRNHRPIETEDEYVAYVQNVADAEIREAAEALGVDPDSPDDPDELLEAVDGVLWENVHALQLFARNNRLEYTAVLAFQQGGIERFTDYETYVAGESLDEAIESLALACVHFDVYEEVLDQIGE